MKQKTCPAVAQHLQIQLRCSETASSQMFSVSLHSNMITRFLDCVSVLWQMFRSAIRWLPFQACFGKFTLTIKAKNACEWCCVSAASVLEIQIDVWSAEVQVCVDLSTSGGCKLTCIDPFLQRLSVRRSRRSRLKGRSTEIRDIQLDVHKLRSSN